MTVTLNLLLHLNIFVLMFMLLFTPKFYWLALLPISFLGLQKFKNINFSGNFLAYACISLLIIFSYMVITLFWTSNVSEGVTVLGKVLLSFFIALGTSIFLLQNQTKFLSRFNIYIIVYSLILFVLSLNTNYNFAVNNFLENTFFEFLQRGGSQVVNVNRSLTLYSIFITMYICLFAARHTKSIFETKVLISIIFVLLLSYNSTNQSLLLWAFFYLLLFISCTSTITYVLYTILLFTFLIMTLTNLTAILFDTKILNLLFEDILDIQIGVESIKNRFAFYEFFISFSCREYFSCIFGHGIGSSKLISINNMILPDGYATSLYGIRILQKAHSMHLYIIYELGLLGLTILLTPLLILLIKSYWLNQFRFVVSLCVLTVLYSFAYNFSLFRIWVLCALFLCIQVLFLRVNVR